MQLLSRQDPSGPALRIGTSEFYGVVEALPEISESLVVHLADDAGGPGELLLFVALEKDVELDDPLRARIAAALREGLSPRHVPDRIFAIPAVPRTLNGKKLEVPVRRILSGDAAAAEVGFLDLQGLTEAHHPGTGRRGPRAAPCPC